MLRYEYKYIVPVQHLDTLRQLIRPFMQLDKHAPVHRGEYTVRSVYFDTPDLECFYQKLAGVKRRNKVRLRGYNDQPGEGKVFFEIKKKVDEPLLKNRAGMHYEEILQILGGTPPEQVFHRPEDHKSLDNARRFLYHLHARKMRPVVTVVYEREPFQSVLADKDNDFRITFDKNLRAVPYPSAQTLFEAPQEYPVCDNFFILEAKFNRYLPAWAKAVIQSLGLVKGPASKYLMCVQACPEIRAGRVPRLRVPAPVWPGRNTLLSDT